ncbi:MAG: primosomal protein N', partial [Coleofasciculaceae cyanobacterium]
MSNSHSGVVLAEPRASYQTAASDERWVEVLVDCQGLPQEDQEVKLYTYKLPADLDVLPGDIVSVPFKTQQLGGIAIRLLDTPPDLDIKIREVGDIISSGFFRTTYWQLLEQVAQYYCTPLIWVIRSALPPGLL